MALTKILELLGVGGSVVMVVSAVVMLYHGRSVLAFLGQVATWIRVVGVVAFLAVLAMAGLIPGIKLSVDIETLGAFLGGITAAGWSLAKQFLPVLVIA